MSENEKNALIVEALRSRTESRQRAKLLAAHLCALGGRLRQLADSLSPAGPREPDWETVHASLAIPHPITPLAEILSIDRLSATVAELIEAQRNVDEKTAALRAYGCE